MEWSNKNRGIHKNSRYKITSNTENTISFHDILTAHQKVDLGRIELPSKRGNHMLSTCLSLPSVFEHKQDQSHQPMPYLLIFRKSYGEELKLSPILLCRFIKRFEQELLSDISFPPLWQK